MKKNLLFFLMAAFLFVACDKEDTNISKDSSAFSIDGYIVDGDGNVPLKAVTVKGAFGETKTDDKGYFNIGGLNHGTYSVIFEMSGYGQMIQTFALAANTDSPLEVNYTASTIVSMFKMEKSMETTLWKTMNNKREVLANVPYTINLLSPNSGVTFLYNKIEGVTDANGKISLSDTLPNTSVNLVVEYIDQTAGKIYRLDQDVNPTTVSKSLNVSVDNLSETLYLVDSNIFDENGKLVNNFKVDAALTIEFNKAIDAKTTAKLYNESEDVWVAVNVSVSGNTLTIDPVGNLLTAKSYEVTIEAVSGDDEVNKSYVFYTEGGVVALDKVSGLSLKNSYKVYVTNTGADIEFSKVTGAESYEIYGKYGTQTEYQKFKTVYATNDATSTREEMYLSLNNVLPDMDIPSAGMFADGNKFTIIVRALANNGDMIGAFSEPYEIKKNAEIE